MTSETSRDRLRAALEEIVRGGYTGAEYIARKALSGEPNSARGTIMLPCGCRKVPVVHTCGMQSESSGSAVETSGDWRPIETVPDPQITPVLGAVPRDAGDFAVGEMHRTDVGWYWAGNDPSDSGAGQIYPTYWQPLPNPPGSAVKASED